MKFRRPKTSGQAGFSLIEFMIAMSILLVLSGALVETTGSLRNLAVSGGDRANLQSLGDKALLRVVEELRSSGTVISGARTYPYVFDAGAPNAAFLAHTHPPAAGVAVAGDVDFGVDREVVFLLPRDLDDDQRPDIDAAGALIWDVREMSYIVTTRADGVNYLERRTDAADPRAVGKFVERMVIDNAESSGFQIPLNSVRIRLFFRRVDGQGNIIRYSNEAVVALRNGQVGA